MDQIAPEQTDGAFRRRLVRYAVVSVVVTLVAAVLGGAYATMHLPGDPEGEDFALVSAVVWGAMAMFMCVLVAGAVEVFRVGRQEPGGH